jgi:hypothetical protein
LPCAEATLGGDERRLPVRVDEALTPELMIVALTTFCFAGVCSIMASLLGTAQFLLSMTKCSREGCTA